jgi:arabinose-5-phosphate isomerase
MEVKEIATRVINKEIEGLTALKQTIDNDFVEVIDLFLQTEGRIIVAGIGKSGHIAKKIAATLASTGSPSFFLHPAEASHGDLGMITEKDVVLILSYSGSSTELNHIVDYCKRFDIKLICICADPESILVKAADYRLIIPKVEEASNLSAPTTSTTMMLALGDAIAVVLQEKRKFNDSDFKLFHPGGNIGAKLIKVYEIMHKGTDIPSVSGDVTAFSALIEMSNKRLGCVGIVDKNNRLIGIFTDGDIRRNIQYNFNEVDISSIMTSNPITVSPDLFASEALRIMNKKSISNLFIIDNGEPVGVLHIHDLLSVKIL